jgi:predicted acetyltransferase
VIEIRMPDDGDRREVAEIMRVSFNLPAPRFEERAGAIQLDQLLCGYDGTRVIAAGGARPFRQWFGGIEVPMCGVYSVVTLPEYRGTGIATRIVGQLMHRDREAGVPIAALFPAILRPYRRMGFELAGMFTEYGIPLDDLPAVAGPLAVEEYGPADLDGVRACYRLAATAHNGPIDCDDAHWWPRRILGGYGVDGITRTVTARGDGDIQGYAAFVQAPAQGELETSFDVACKHLVAATPEALTSLIGYFRGFRGIGQSLRFIGPPAEPMTLMVDELKVKPTWSYRWMLRIMDVPGAFEARGYAPVSGRATVSVEDAMFADNSGTFRIEAEQGKVQVTREGNARPIPRAIPIGVLSSMYTGYLQPRDAVRFGHLDGDDPAVPFLSNLLAGPTPWMYDWF